MKDMKGITTVRTRTVLAAVLSVLFALGIYAAGMSAAHQESMRYAAEAVRTQQELRTARALVAREKEIVAAYEKETAAEKKETGGDLLKRIEALAVKSGAVVKDLRKNEDGTFTLDMDAAPDAQIGFLIALKDSGLCKMLVNFEAAPGADGKTVRAVLRAALYGNGDVF